MLYDDDDAYFYLNFTDLPMEDQRPLTFQDQIDKINRAFLPEDATSHLPPLTTDVRGRGYPPSEAELRSVSLINKLEKDILMQDANTKPFDNHDKFFIVEDGRVFKVQETGMIYDFDFDKAEWTLYPDYVVLFYDNHIKYSRLRNFRDYYKENP